MSQELETRAGAPAALEAGLAAPAPRAEPNAPAPVHTFARLAAAIVQRLENRRTRFELELDPDGLGRVEVKVEVGPSGALTAALRCDDPAAAELLRGRAHELKAALQQAGFDLSGGLSFTSGEREPPREAPRAWSRAGPTEDVESTLPPTPQRSAARSGQVDIRI
ncbi:MAG TPA: flagellar hook-length control protein FliK [Caulobacteraceae bacterium]